MKAAWPVPTNHGPGQCFEVMLASLLEIETHEVPARWAGAHVPADAPMSEQHPPDRLRALLDWLRAVHRVHPAQVIFRDQPPTADIPALFARSVRGLSGLDEPPSWAVHHGIFGLHPEGRGHIVVGRRGVRVHDPDWRRMDFTCVCGFFFLIPVDLEPVPSPGFRRDVPRNYGTTSDWFLETA